VLLLAISQLPMALYTLPLPRTNIPQESTLMSGEPIFPAIPGCQLDRNSMRCQLGHHFEQTHVEIAGDDATTMIHHQCCALLPKLIPSIVEPCLALRRLEVQVHI
jgi:hypothetical protein